MPMTPGGSASGKPGASAPPPPPTLIESLRARPRRTALLGIVALGVLVLLGFAWATRGAETWIVVSPGEMQLTVGGSQPLTVALMYKPHFRTRGFARPIAATIQLIAFPKAVDVAPTTVVTTGAAPQASMKVTAVREGEEELVLAGSNTPAEQRSWQTTSMKVHVRR